MHVKLRRSAVAFVLGMAWATPLVAQQNSGKARLPQTPAARDARQGTARQAVPPAGNGPNPNGRPSYPARQAGAAEQPAARTAQAPAGAAIKGVAPGAPFQLTPQEQQLLDQILVRWEMQSDRVKTFKCSFGRWEINETFGPKENKFLLSEGAGYIKFKAPDHGIYRISEMKEWDRQRASYAARTTGLDHWVCDGKAIYEFNAEKRQLIERQLAPEMQGKAIANGPLPFIFGAKADRLKQRYWMRDKTPAEEVKTRIWLEAWPKFQQDAANFHHAIVILNLRDFMPEALEIILPDGKNKQDYAFSGTQVNDPLSILKGDFLPPIKPLGWEKVVEPAQSPQQIAAPGNPPAQAQRPPGALPRQ